MISGRSPTPLASALAALAALVAMGCVACGGATEGDKQTQPRGRPGQPTVTPKTVKAQPMEFEVEGKRVGSAVYLDIIGTGRGHLEGERFEDPESWTIRCWRDAEELPRVVNGSARVERAPVGPVDENRWDVTVNYSVGFALPDIAAQVEVQVAAPGARMFRDRVALAEDDEDLPLED